MIGEQIAIHYLASVSNEKAIGNKDYLLRDMVSMPQKMKKKYILSGTH